MEQIYNNVILGNGKKAKSFHIIIKNGSTSGIYCYEENRIFVHHVSCNNGLKEIMNILIKKFNTNKITFTPLITAGILDKVRGEIKTLLSNDVKNPYGEDIVYLECIWELI